IFVVAFKSRSGTVKQLGRNGHVTFGGEAFGHIANMRVHTESFLENHNAGMRGGISGTCHIAVHAASIRDFECYFFLRSFCRRQEWPPWSSQTLDDSRRNLDDRRDGVTDAGIAFVYPRPSNRLTQSRARNYSDRSVEAGLMRATCKEGRKPATAAAQSISKDTASRVMGSRFRTPNNWLFISRKAKSARTRPAVIPPATGRRPDVVVSLIARATVQPRAIRMPMSRRRCRTMLEISP